MLPPDFDTCNVINNDSVLYDLHDSSTLYNKPSFHHDFTSCQDQGLDPSLPYPRYQQELHRIISCQPEDFFHQQIHSQLRLGDDHRQGLKWSNFDDFHGVASETANNKNMPASRGNNPKKTRNRSSASKRDRHSKISTAKGLRDRRMRLSLDVARDFFGLQDILGFDKASKTVEWLLIQAKSAIQKLTKDREYPQPHNSLCSIGSKSNSSVNYPECDVASGSIDDAPINGGGACKSAAGSSRKEKKMKEPPRRNTLRSVPKDSRAKARERAKERAREKRIMRGREDQPYELKLCDGEEMVMLNETSCFGDSKWNSFGIVDESAGIQSYNNRDINPYPDSHLVMSQGDTGDDNLSAVSNWSPSTNFSYHPNSETVLEHQFTNLPPFGGQSEFYNNQSMW